MEQRLKQITEILHTIFCRKYHEDDIMKVDKTDNCCYYIEQNIEDTWNMKDHNAWVEQADVFMQLAGTSGIDPLDKIITIYKKAEELRKLNPLYMKYVEVLIKQREE